MSVNWSYKSCSRHFYIQIFGNLWLVPCYSHDSKLSNTKKQVIITFSPLKLRVWILDKYELKLKNHRPLNYPTKLRTFVFWFYLLSDDDFDKIRGRIHQTAQQILAWFKVWKVVFWKSDLVWYTYFSALTLTFTQIGKFILKSLACRIS